MDAKRKLRRAGQTAWIVEPHGRVLIRLASGLRRNLSCTEAAVWDLLTRGRSGESIRSRLELIAGIGPQEAQRLVDSCLAQWLTEGWLVETGPETEAPE
jgi:hypothetical protein